MNQRDGIGVSGGEERSAHALHRTADFAKSLSQKSRSSIIVSQGPLSETDKSRSALAAATAQSAPKLPSRLAPPCHVDKHRLGTDRDIMLIKESHGEPCRFCLPKNLNLRRLQGYPDGAQWPSARAAVYLSNKHI
jgi:hypothetical protein